MLGKSLMDRGRTGGRIAACPRSPGPFPCLICLQSTQRHLHPKRLFMIYCPSFQLERQLHEDRDCSVDDHALRAWNGLKCVVAAWNRLRGASHPVQGTFGSLTWSLQDHMGTETAQKGMSELKASPGPDGERGLPSSIWNSGPWVSCCIFKPQSMWGWRRDDQRSKTWVKRFFQMGAGEGFLEEVA